MWGKQIIRDLKCVRRCSTSASKSQLRARLTELVPEYQARLLRVRKKYDDRKIGEISVRDAIGGMRGLKCMLCETSLLDEKKGIRFRGYSIPELQNVLPKVPNGSQPIPEGILWLLLTAEVPTAEQAQSVTEELRSRSIVPDYVQKLIDSYPKKMHPMTQLASAVLALQPESKFAQAYSEGIHRNKYWEYYFEDSLDLIAKLPTIAARIFRNKYRMGMVIEPRDKFDWGQNYAHMLGFDDPDFYELMRLYLTIHADHEGGNVSAHATHLVGSALADPYLAFASGLNGLAGPLHGLANQQVLKWLIEFNQEIGQQEPTAELISQAVQATLDSGNVIPGYGHAVLRDTDPRYTVQREFAQKHLPENHLFKLVSSLYGVVPGILSKLDKVQNPWPNVDAHSGVLLHHYGLVESEYYTVLFGVSRSIGVLSSLVMDRILRLPIERPKSVSMDYIEKLD